MKIRVIAGDAALIGMVLDLKPYAAMQYKCINTGFVFTDTWGEVAHIEACCNKPTPHANLIIELIKEQRRKKPSSHYSNLHLFTDTNGRLQWVEEIAVIQI